MNLCKQSFGVLAMVLAAGTAMGQSTTLSGGAAGTRAESADTHADLPAVITLQATIRDVKSKNESGGHPDFQAFGSSRATTELVNDTLGEDGKPVLRNGGVGRRIAPVGRSTPRTLTPLAATAPARTTTRATGRSPRCRASRVGTPTCPG